MALSPLVYKVGFLDARSATVVPQGRAQKSAGNIMDTFLGQDRITISWR